MENESSAADNGNLKSRKRDPIVVNISNLRVVHWLRREDETTGVVEFESTVHGTGINEWLNTLPDDLPNQKNGRVNVEIKGTNEPLEQTIYEDYDGVPLGRTLKAMALQTMGYAKLNYWHEDGYSLLLVTSMGAFRSICDSINRGHVNSILCQYSLFTGADGSSPSKNENGTDKDYFHLGGYLERLSMSTNKQEEDQSPVGESVDAFAKKVDVINKKLDALMASSSRISSHAKILVLLVAAILGAVFLK